MVLLRVLKQWDMKPLFLMSFCYARSFIGKTTEEKCILWFVIIYILKWELPLFDQENVTDNQIIFTYLFMCIQKKYSSSRENLDFCSILNILPLLLLCYIASRNFIIYVFTLPKTSKMGKKRWMGKNLKWKLKNKQLETFLHSCHKN